MKSVEFTMLCRLIEELRAEVRAVKNGVDHKIDSVAKTVMDAFQGFGILDPEEDTWTEKQVCERYQISRKTMYNYREADRIPYTKMGTGKHGIVRYRKADVIEFFATLNN